jgi:hypothetical protein
MRPAQRLQHLSVINEAKLVLLQLFATPFNACVASTASDDFPH